MAEYSNLDQAGRVRKLQEFFAGPRATDQDFLHSQFPASGFQAVRAGIDSFYGCPLVQRFERRPNRGLPVIPESKRYLASLPKAEIEAVRSYLNGAPKRAGKVRPATAELTGRGALPTRPAQHAQTASAMVPKTMRRLRRAIANAPVLQEDLVVYRGSAMPHISTNAVLDPALFSTTVAFEVAEKFSIAAAYPDPAKHARLIQAIRLPEATPFLYFPGRDPNEFKEREVLLYGTLVSEYVAPGTTTRPTLQFLTYVPAAPPSGSSSTISAQSSLSSIDPGSDGERNDYVSERFSGIVRAQQPRARENGAVDEPASGRSSDKGAWEEGLVWQGTLF